MKCQACHEQQADYAWQPFGPGETPNTFTTLGSHYRGFPVIKVCSTCRLAFETGDFVVRFQYKGHRFIAKEHRVEYEQISFWDGGTSTFASVSGSGTLIMQDTIDGAELAAMVVEPELVNSFLAAPELLAACEAVERAFQAVDTSHFTAEQHLALAKARLAAKEARGES